MVNIHGIDNTFPLTINHVVHESSQPVDCENYISTRDFHVNVDDGKGSSIVNVHRLNTTSALTVTYESTKHCDDQIKFPKEMIGKIEHEIESLFGSTFMNNFKCLIWESEMNKTFRQFSSCRKYSLVF